MAVVDKADRVEFGVPLARSVNVELRSRNKKTHGPSSDGVTGSEGGGGKLIKVGVVMMDQVSKGLVCG